MLKTFRKNPRLVIFAMLAAFFSGPGQTFLVSVFTPYMEESFGWSHARFGSIYGAATLTGAFALPFLGRLLDRMALLVFTLWMGASLAMACLILNLSEWVALTFVGFIMLRCFGQGAMGLIAATATARFFTISRGKALSLASLGYPLSSAILPLLVAAWIEYFGWRSGWSFLALMILILFLPLVWLLLGGKKATKKVPDIKSKPARKLYMGIIKDVKFYMALVCGNMEPFIVTGIFLYQVKLGSFQGWGPTLMATAFAAFSVSRFFSSLLIGPWVDRKSGVRMNRFILIPLLASFAVFQNFQDTWAAFVFMALIGMSVGFGSSVKTAMWAELYGKENIGSVKGLAAFFAVISTAAAPPIFGLLYDRGWGPSEIFLLCTIIATGGVAAASILSVLHSRQVSNQV